MMAKRWPNDGWPTYAKVAPEPTMYFPSILMTPVDPAPYWNIVTTPPRDQQGLGCW